MVAGLGKGELLLALLKFIGFSWSFGMVFGRIGFAFVRSVPCRMAAEGGRGGSGSKGGLETDSGRNWVI